MEISSSRSVALIDIEGPPVARGEQFGRACRDQIKAYPEILRRTIAHESRLRNPVAQAPSPSIEDLVNRALRFLPKLDRYAPEQVEEIRGIATGAGVPFGHALLINVRSEVGVFDGMPADGEGCTSFAVDRSATHDGTMLIGQNQDQAGVMEDLVVVLRVTPEHGPRMLMATFGGLMGYPGINDAGVGFMQNSLTNSVWRFGLPHYPMKRRLLEQRSIEDCLAVMKASPVGSCGNYVLVDRNRAIDVELTPDSMAVLASKEGIVAHANHFTDPELKKDDRRPSEWEDTLLRHSGLETLMQDRRGMLSASTMKELLSDHDGHPGSICRHHQPGQLAPVKTIYSVICEPDAGRMHLRLGNPCQGPYQVFEFD